MAEKDNAYREGFLEGWELAKNEDGPYWHSSPLTAEEAYARRGELRAELDEYKKRFAATLDAVNYALEQLAESLKLYEGETSEG